MRLLRAALRKLIRRPASWVVAIILFAILTLFYLAIGASAGQIPEGQQREQIELLLRDETGVRLLLGLILSLGGLLAVAYAAAIGGAEWAWGTLRVVVARGESRSRYILMTFVAVAIMLAIALLAAFVVGFGLFLLSATMAGVPLPSLSAGFVTDLPRLLGLAWIGLLEHAAIGFAVATIARSQVAGIGAGVALYVLEQFISLAFRNESRYLPFTVAESLVADPRDAAAAGFQLLDPTLALGLTLFYLALALVAAALVTERVEITA